MEFLIKEICDLVGLSPRAVRYYEKEGLLPEAVRTFGNYRVFGVEDVVDLLRIKRLRALGFSLDQIRSILKSPASDETIEFVRELDSKLAQELEQITNQRTAITEIFETGAPLDVVPEFATLIAQRKGIVYSDVTEDERDKMRIEMLAEFGTEDDKQRTADILQLQASAPDDPLMVALNDLDARFAVVDDTTPGDEIEELIDAYVDTLSELYSKIADGAPSEMGAERSAALYDGVQADIVRQIMDRVRRRLNKTAES